jgi:hypothetical protein
MDAETYLCENGASPIVFFFSYFVFVNSEEDLDFEQNNTNTQILVYNTIQYV